MRSTFQQIAVRLALVVGVALVTAVRPSHASSPPIDAPKRKAWLGIVMRESKTNHAKVTVLRVLRTSPADQAGLRDGDVLHKLDGKPVTSAEQVVALVAAKAPGDTLEVVFVRADTERKTTVVLDAFPGQEEVFRRDRIGTAAPRIEGTTVKGQVEPFKNKVTIVEFWASWCVPCKALVPVLNDVADKHAARGLRVVGVALEPVEAAAKGAAHFGIRYAVVADTSRRAEAAYGPPAVPTAFVIDKRGKIRDVLIGFSVDEKDRLNRLVTKLLDEKDDE